MLWKSSHILQSWWDDRGCKGRKKDKSFDCNRKLFSYRFKTSFQQDYYETTILSKATPVIICQHIDWDAMARHNDPIFTRIAEACEVKGLTTLLVSGINVTVRTKG